MQRKTSTGWGWVGGWVGGFGWWGGGGNRGLNSNYFSYAADKCKNGEQLKNGLGLSLSNKPVLV